MTLRELLRHGAAIDAVSGHLDALDHDGRMREIYTLNRGDLQTLYDIAAAAPPLTPAHFVPDDATAPVPHQGWNSVPVPSPWRRFAKVFTRPADPASAPAGHLIGYNDYRSGWWMGPGYFKLVSTAHEPGWVERGAWVVDYLQVPEGPAPEGWPAIVPNEKGPQKLVYAGTRDFMRRASAHVSVGCPFKGDDAMPFCFAVCRVV